MMRFRRAPRSGKLRELENLRVTGKKTPPGRAGTHTGQRARYLKIHTFTRTYRKGLLIDDSTDDALGVAVLISSLLKLLPRVSRVYRPPSEASTRLSGRPAPPPGRRVVRISAYVCVTWSSPACVCGSAIGCEIHFINSSCACLWVDLVVLVGFAVCVPCDCVLFQAS